MAEGHRSLSPSERLVIAALWRCPAKSGRAVYHALSGLEAARHEDLAEVTSVHGVLLVLDRLALAELVRCSKDGTWDLSPRTRELVRLGELASGSLLEVLHG